MTDLLIFDYLLSNSHLIDTNEIPSVKDWKNLFFKHTDKWQNTVDKAIAGSFYSDRLAYAFVSGYWSALSCLIPSLPDKSIASLCVTEKEGNHPKQIKTELKPESKGDRLIWLLNGNKKFVTCANEADLLLVAASTGISPNGQNNLRLVRIENHIPGLSTTPLNSLTFIPEISHGELAINNIRITESQILPGDAYINYIKPFRTLEDIHITSAVLGYLFRIALLFHWPQDVKEQILAFLAGIKTVSLSNPLDNAVHIILGGISSLFVPFIESIEPHWKLTDKKTYCQWERDKAILNIAGKARSQRLSTAWANYKS